MKILMSKDCPWRPVNDSGILYFTAGRSSDEKITVKFDDSLEGEERFLIIHSFFPDANTRLIELLLVINCLKSMTSDIRLLLPYMCYSGQDESKEKCSVRSHQVVLGMLQSFGVKYIFTMEAYFHSIENVMPLLRAAAKFMTHTASEGHWAYLLEIVRHNVISPFVLAVSQFERDAVIIINDNYLQDGDVGNKTCFLVDDTVDSVETICKAADVLKQHGAWQVIAFVTHAVLSGEGRSRLESCNSLDLFVTTDLITQPHGQDITTLPIIEMLVEQIQN